MVTKWSIEIINLSKNSKMCISRTFGKQKLQTVRKQSIYFLLLPQQAFTNYHSGLSIRSNMIFLSLVEVVEITNPLKWRCLGLKLGKVCNWSVSCLAFPLKYNFKQCPYPFKIIFWKAPDRIKGIGAKFEPFIWFVFMDLKYSFLHSRLLAYMISTQI